MNNEFETPEYRSQHAPLPARHSGKTMSFVQAMEHIAALKPAQAPPPVPHPRQTLADLTARYHQLREVHEAARLERKKMTIEVENARKEHKQAVLRVKEAQDRLAEAVCTPEEGQALLVLSAARSKVTSLQDRINALETAIGRLGTEGEEYSRLQDLRRVAHNIFRAIVQSEMERLPAEALAIIHRASAFSIDGGLGPWDEWLVKAIKPPKQEDLKALRAEVLSDYKVEL